MKIDRASTLALILTARCRVVLQQHVTAGDHGPVVAGRVSDVGRNGRHKKSQ
jgi:hypothetical protein